MKKPIFLKKKVFDKEHLIMTGSFLFDRIWEAISNCTTIDIQEIISELENSGEKIEEYEFGSEAVLISIGKKQSTITYDILSRNLKSIYVENAQLLKILKEWASFLQTNNITQKKENESNTAIQKHEIRDLAMEKRLIKLYSEYETKFGGGEINDLESLKSNYPPKYYRYLMIKSLLKAFELPTDLFDFEEGVWLDEWDKDRCKNVSEEINSLLINENQITKISVSELTSFEFRSLLHYRTSLENIINHEQGDLNEWAANIISLINEPVFEKIKILDEILSIIINPKSKIVTEKDLVEKYSFPIINLNECDFDYYWRSES